MDASVGALTPGSQLEVTQMTEQNSTILVRALNKSGVCLSHCRAENMAEARAYAVRNSAPEFIDGFTIEGIGAVRVVRTIEGHAIGFSRLIDGQFVKGGPELIA